MNSDEEGAVNKKSLVMLSSDDDSLNETFYGDRVVGQVNEPIQKHTGNQDSMEEGPIPLVSAPIREDPVAAVTEDFHPIQDTISST